MVEVLEPYVQEIADIKADLPKILRKILKDNEVQVLQILKSFQLTKGLDANGKVIGTYSVNTPSYIDPSNEPRQDKIPGAPYNFEWTGSLFDKMFMHFEDLNSYSLFSKDSKARMLEAEYGDIFTLTDKNNNRINNEILRPEMYEEIIKRLYY